MRLAALWLLVYGGLNSSEPLVLSPYILVCCTIPFTCRPNIVLRWRKDVKLNATSARQGHWILDVGRPGSLLQLFIVSFASLYVEVMLIRWLGTEFRIFAYIQNLTLVACFLGFGLGCLKSSAQPAYLFDFRALSLLVLIVDLPVREWKAILDVVVSGLAANSDLSVWAVPERGAVLIKFLIAAAMVSGILLLVIATMVPLGAWVASCLESSARIVTAYSVNLLGSLIGVWGFAGLSFLNLPPIVWFAIAFALLLLMQPRVRDIGLAGGLILVACLGILEMGHGRSVKTIWSPYQKLEVRRAYDDQYQISVNNSGYMTIANLTPELLQRDPSLRDEYAAGNSYDTPYRFAQALDKVLIVGSGAGNDVAAALRNGAGHIDAVEIDPVIYGFGRTLHPEKPYQSGKVRVILDDARDFMRGSTNRYDLIVFGLLDSHTQSSSLSNMRIDNYVYTRESFEDAKRLLKPGGVLVIKFEVRSFHEWMGQRFYSMLSQIFSHPPVAFYCAQVAALLPASVFIESQDTSFWNRASSPELAKFVMNHPLPYALSDHPDTEPTTDDWPYLYHRGRTIPKMYLSVSGVLILLAYLLVRRNFSYREARTWEFFFLGAGFLLLETQMVGRLALYFGSTWIVNCVVLTFVLLVLIAANLAVDSIKRIRLGPLYLALVLALLVIYLVPWARLPLGSRAIGLVLGTAFSVPLFFAGIIFTESFRRAGGAAKVFGANILGAVAGGLAQNFSFVFGVKALLIVAAVFYAIAGLTRLFTRSAQTISPANAIQTSA